MRIIGVLLAAFHHRKAINQVKKKRRKRRRRTTVNQIRGHLLVGQKGETDCLRIAGENNRRPVRGVGYLERLREWLK
jgi:hypothetical protein